VAAVTLSVTGDGGGLKQTLSARATSSAPGLRRATIDQVMLLAGLGLGDHVLTVTATLEGGKPVTRTLGFHVATR
jgi:hypothetical protein